MIYFKMLILEKNVNFSALEVAKICPEDLVKDLFQNVNFGEKCKFCNIGVAKNSPEGPVKNVLQNVNFRE